MSVFFDFQIFYAQKYGGISRYFIELARALHELNEEVKIIAPYHGNKYLEQEANQDFVLTYNLFMKKLHYNRFYGDPVLENKKVLKRFLKKPSSILHETYYADRTPVTNKKVVTIHDMIYELFHNNLPDELEIIKMKHLAMKEADAIIAVSENTKKDIERLYPELSKKVFVVHHGVSTIDLKNVPEYKHSKPYVLFVGKRGWYKNFSSLLEVFYTDQRLGDSHNIIAFGGGDFSEEETDLISKYKLEGKVLNVQGSDETLNSLYRSAACMAYISNYEGFGMIVLEAMALGCPVVCSDSSSLPEVAGDAAELVNTKSIESIKAGLEKVLFNDDHRNFLRAKGLERVTEFTWKKCALETNKIYKSL